MFTKTIFNEALSCPTKLFYTKNDEYENQQKEDSFLEALAKGGYQVGELAKYKYSNDPITEEITVETLDYSEAISITNSKLNESKNVVIAEGAFSFKNFFVRVDILVKDGNKLKLIEVKSKSIGKNDVFIKGDKVKSSWQPYLYDLAFQTYVLEKALPDFEIDPYLLLIDKDEKANTDGLNQLFKVKKDINGRTSIVVDKSFKGFNSGNLSILREIPMRETINKLNTLPVPNVNVPLENSQLVDFIPWAEALHTTKKRHWSKPSIQCKNCNYKKSNTLKKCGFSECWSNHNWEKIEKIAINQLNEPLITDLWMGLGGAKISKNVMSQNVPYISMLDSDLLKPTSNSDDKYPGMTPHERRVYQINSVKSKSSSYIFLKEKFMEFSKDWKYPLNMIDFETSTVALPYFKGMRPYETVAFQFSHHIMHEDGNVEHFNDYISWEPNTYPNVEFVRELKKSLESNGGTIFRYAAHENSVLNKIKDDLMQIKPDGFEELINFIDEITEYKNNEGERREGKRNMVDLAEVVRSFYYSPFAGGSNSIKQILPAIINDCKHLRERYSNEDLYGKSKEYSSLNFENHTWITNETNHDPYKTLHSFDKIEGLENTELFDDLGEVADGSAAMMAYNKLQWSYISDKERSSLKKALLQYCELDTLAMVIIMQGLFSLEERE